MTGHYSARMKPQVYTKHTETISRSFTTNTRKKEKLVEQDPELVARSAPIRRQLLGAMGDGSDRLGKDPGENPSSQHWFSDDWDSVPLKAWAEEQAVGAESEVVAVVVGSGLAHLQQDPFAVYIRDIRIGRHTEFGYAQIETVVTVDYIK